MDRPLDRVRKLVPHIALALVLGFALWLATVNEANRRARDDERGAQALIESCQRVNVLRQEVNNQGQVLREFLDAAADARMRASVSSEDPEQSAIDQDTSERYRALARSMVSVELPDCEVVVRQ